MTPEAMAALHARAFAGRGRAWSAGEFADLLDSQHVFAVYVPGGFALGRVSADEAELLTIATDPDLRRKGIGRQVLAAFEARALQNGARVAFLEVAQDNIAACALYAQAGYHEIARRAGYYQTPEGGKADALVLQKALL